MSDDKDVGDLKDIYDVGPVLDCFSGMVLAYWTLAKQLELDARSGLANEWFQRAQETAKKFNLDLFFNLEPFDQSSLPRSPPPFNRAFSETAIATNGASILTNGTIARSNANDEVTEQNFEQLSRAKERPQSARPRLVQYYTSSSHSNGVTSSSNSTPGMSKPQVNTEFRVEDAMNPNTTSIVHAGVASLPAGSPASEVRIRPKSAVSKLGGGYSMPTQSSPISMPTELEPLNADVHSDSPTTGKLKSAVTTDESIQNKEFLREQLIQQQIATLRKDRSILVRQVKPIEDSNKPLKKSKQLKNSPKRSHKPAAVHFKHSTILSTDKSFQFKQQDDAVMYEKVEHVITDSAEMKSKVKTTSTTHKLYSEISNLVDETLLIQSEGSKTLNTSTEKNISVPKPSLAAPQSFKFIKQISNNSLSSIQR